MDKNQRITINQERRLYVINVGSGYTCFGFDNCWRGAVELAHRMDMPQRAPQASEIGSVECYEKYQSLLADFAKHPASKKTWFEPGTPKKVIDVLQRAINFTREGVDSQQLRLFFGDPETGRDWCEEFETVGFIGRSGGTMKTPLLMEPLLKESGFLARAESGSPIPTHRVLRIVDVATGEELYRAKNYQLPELEVLVDTAHKSHRFAVQRDGHETLARFATKEDAEKHIAFLKGYRVSNTPRTWNEYLEDFELIAA